MGIGEVEGLNNRPRSRVIYRDGEEKGEAKGAAASPDRRSIMKTRLIVTALGLLILTAGSTTGWTQTDASAGTTQPMNPWGWTGVNPLGLSADQMTEIQQIVMTWQTELTPIWAEMQTKSMELQSLMMNPSADPSAVSAKTKEISNLQVEIQEKSLEKQKAVRDVLSDEQKAIYDQQGLGYGWGMGPCGMGLGAGWSGGYGRGAWGRGGRRGFGRGGGWGAGGAMGMTGWMAPGYGRGMGVGMAPGMGMTGYPGVGWGRGPCGMGLGRTQMWNGMGRRRW
jgi:Spy/CpxP family protein refolding chaperone